MTQPTPFRGFPQDGLDFLTGLAEDNSTSYFDAHRSTYQDHVLAPSKAFVVALGKELRPRISADLVADARVNASIFRINRDIRFSADKTPYHTDLRFVFWEHGDRTSAPAFFVRVEPRFVSFAAGVRELDRSKVDRFRAAVDDDTSGQALVEAIATTRKAIRAELSDPHYKRVPKPYEADHPRAELLRHTGLYVWAEQPTPKSVSTARFVTWCANRLEKLAPVQRWWVHHVT